LASDRRTELEERILCDPEVYEELLVNEEDLIDQYVAGSLSGLEKHQFETHFLITAERQKNLRFGRLLQKYLTSPPVSGHRSGPVIGQTRQKAPANGSFPFYLASFGRFPALAFSAAVLVCLGLVLWYWILAPGPARSTAEHEPVRVVVVTLVPGTTRSSGALNRVTIPLSGVDVKLELPIANNSFQKYRSELFRESRSLGKQEELSMEARGDRQFVPVTIPRDLLSPGDYQVKLSGVLDSGHNELIDNYSFRVVTE
jgi:hypothetical protein